MACGKMVSVGVLNGHQSHLCSDCHFMDTQISEEPCISCFERSDGCCFLDAETGE